MGWNYLPIPKLQWCNHWSLGMDKYFYPTLCWACDYLSMPVFKSINLSHWITPDTASIHCLKTHDHFQHSVDSMHPISAVPKKAVKRNHSLTDSMHAGGLGMTGILWVWQWWNICAVALQLLWVTMILVTASPPVGPATELAQPVHFTVSMSNVTLGAFIMTWCPIFKSNHCNSFESEAPVDFICWSLISKWVVVTWLHGSIYCELNLRWMPQDISW